MLFDTQFLATTADHFATLATLASQQPASLAVVLHPNPDKFNGTASLQARGATVVSSEQVLAHIPAVHEQRLRVFGERYGSAYPRCAAQPDSFGAQSTTLRVSTLEIRCHVLPGVGCSRAHVVAQVGEHAFVGDLVARHCHAWLELGAVDSWLQQLDLVAAMRPRWVHAGRGGTGPATVLDDQRRYLERVRDAVAELRPAGPPDADALAPIADVLCAAYPEYAYPVFLNQALPAVWRTLTGPTDDAS